MVNPEQQAGLEKVYFGAWVTLYSLDRDTEHIYRIVGQDEIDTGKGYISWVSPMAKALLGKEVGATITVQTPMGEESYEILEVNYQAPAETKLL